MHSQQTQVQTPAQLSLEEHGELPQPSPSPSSLQFCCFDTRVSALAYLGAPSFSPVLGQRSSPCFCKVFHLPSPCEYSSPSSLGTSGWLCCPIALASQGAAHRQLWAHVLCCSPRRAACCLVAVASGMPTMCMMGHASPCFSPPMYCILVKLTHQSQRPQESTPLGLSVIWSFLLTPAEYNSDLRSCPNLTSCFPNSLLPHLRLGSDWASGSFS